MPEADGLGVEDAAGAGGGDREVAGEADAAIVEVGVADELEAAQSQGPEVELSGRIRKNKEEERQKDNE